MIIGYNGLCYQRCIWRCNIKRFINEKDNTDYLFCAENTTYGNILQNAITYHKQLLVKLNIWVAKLNTEIFKPFNNNELERTYSLKFDMFSDIFSLDDTEKYSLTYYNIPLLKKEIANISYYKKRCIKKKINKTILLLTNDILAILNVFRHFTESSLGIYHVKQYGLNFDGKKYVNYIYFNNQHTFLSNYYKVLDIINNVN